MASGQYAIMSKANAVEGSRAARRAVARAARPAHTMRGHGGPPH